MSIYDRLEPNIEDAKTSAMDQDIMLSIAISLKRIADVICRPPPELNLSKEDEEELKRQMSFAGTGIIVNKS